MQGGKQEPLGFGRGVRLCSGLTEVVKSDLWCGHSAGLFGASRQVHAIGFCRIGDWRFSVEASDLASAVCPRGWRGGEGGEEGEGEEGEGEEEGIGTYSTICRGFGGGGLGCIYPPLR